MDLRPRGLEGVPVQVIIADFAAPVASLLLGDPGDVASDPFVGEELLLGVVHLAEDDLVGDDVVDAVVAEAAEVEAAVLQLIFGVPALEASPAVGLLGQEVMEGEGLGPCAELAVGEDVVRVGQRGDRAVFGLGCESFDVGFGFGFVRGLGVSKSSHDGGRDPLGK